jgi:hypothetical protein
VIQGVAASIASIIPMAGDTITMGQSSQLVIHNPMRPSAIAFGTAVIWTGRTLPSVDGRGRVVLIRFKGTNSAHHTARHQSLAVFLCVVRYNVDIVTAKVRGMVWCVANNVPS